MRQIAITAHRQAKVIEAPDFSEPPGSDEVRGRTVVSLISPGTELNYAYLAKQGFPMCMGYAAIFRVTEVGSGVTDLPAGALVFGTGGHREYQQAERKDVVPLPDGLAPEKAVFARLAGVSMSTLNTTAARPPSRVLVTGLGPVGNLAAQVFAMCGYQVTAVDPVAKRREIATSAGLIDVRAAIGEGPVDIRDKVMLHVECSGHERAVLDGANAVRKGGEVVLVGVPWQRRTELFAFELLHTVFHRYVVLRSGWEWEVPRHPVDFAGSSIIENLAAAVQWIASGKIKVDGMAGLHAPDEAQKVYQGLLDQSLPTPSAIFDWRTA
jgi:threonine dehydrogenase-like Zn-dependent dehydrogenase